LVNLLIGWSDGVLEYWSIGVVELEENVWRRAEKIAIFGGRSW
jgi:hypothetical protein